MTTKPAAKPKAPRCKTTSPSAIPARTVIAVKNAGVIGSPNNGPLGALVVAKVSANRGEGNGWTLWTGHGRYDLAPNSKIAWTSDARAAIDAQWCEKHQMVYRPWIGGYECAACWNEYDRARRAAIKDGTWKPYGRNAEEKAARLERVTAAAAARVLTQEQMQGNAIRTCAASIARGKHSPATNRDYARARLTELAGIMGLTIERAAELGGVPTWEPMTWAEYRAAHPRKRTAAEAAEDAA